MNCLLDQLAQHGCGLVITVDEVRGDAPELKELAIVYQHFVREGRKVALLMAGLPYHVNALLAGESTSFLRRAALHRLGSVPSYEVREAFRLTVACGGQEIEDDALDNAVDIIGGFPFMFQLLGYRSWNAAGISNTIDTEAISHGSTIAREEMEQRVFAATLSELSEADIAFLLALARSGRAVHPREIQRAICKPPAHISTYKRRLLENGVIEEDPLGRLFFALPGFGNYLIRMVEE